MLKDVILEALLSRTAAQMKVVEQKQEELINDVSDIIRGSFFVDKKSAHLTAAEIITAIFEGLDSLENTLAAEQELEEIKTAVQLFKRTGYLSNIYKRNAYHY